MMDELFWYHLKEQGKYTDKILAENRRNFLPESHGGYECQREAWRLLFWGGKFEMGFETDETGWSGWGAKHVDGCYAFTLVLVS